jgi:high-affinity Fe2+/Pb2+ permease
MATARVEPMMPSSDRRRLIGFWCVAAAAMVLLGINKQLDLQSWFTQTMRELAVEQGWYDDRRQYQFAFIAAVAALGFLATLTTAILMRRVLLRIGLALVGLGVLGAFVVARAASFHSIDALLHSGPFALNWWAEFGGTSLVALNAWVAGRGRI